MTYDKTESLKLGKITEDHFKSIFINCIDATEHENIYEHWDVRIDNIKIDIKGMKRELRNDSSVNGYRHYIELRGVRGHPGWLYGKADYFAFETIEDFLLVEKIKLQKWVDKNIIKEEVTKPELYKLYSRVGRLDQMTLVKTSDLFLISDIFVSKEDKDIDLAKLVLTKIDLTEFVKFSDS